MARHVPSEFADKVRLIQTRVDDALAEDPGDLLVTREVLPGVRLVCLGREGRRVVFSLWVEQRDVAELCGDAAYPAAAGLLAIDHPQLSRLRLAGVPVSISHLTRSESVPGLSYALLDRVSTAAIRLVLERLLPQRISEAGGQPERQRTARHLSNGADSIGSP